MPLTIQQPLQRGISTAVIDEHQLQSNQRLVLEDFIDALNERVETVLLVKTGTTSDNVTRVACAVPCSVKGMLFL